MKRTLIIVMCVQFLILLSLYGNHKLIEENSYSIGCLKEKKLDLRVLDSVVIVKDDYGFGSGVAVQKDLILTAGHCVQDSNMVVIANDGTEYEVISKWKSDKYDIGFIWIDGELPFVQLGVMPELLDACYLVGTPYAQIFQNTITQGIISHLDRDWLSWEDMIQTDAEGARGSSGSPLFNIYGCVVGICVAGPQDGGGVTLCENIEHIKESLDEYLREVLDCH